MQRLLVLLALCVCSVCALRCFVAEYTPASADPHHTVFQFSVDVLTPIPVELTFEALEFGPVLVDRCIWQSRVDALQLHINGALASYWPLHCGDSHTLRFSVGTLGADVWGKTPLAPSDGAHTYALQYGHVDVLSATWSVTQTPSRYRDVVLRLYSGSERQFMGSWNGAVLPVRVCLLDSQVPNDLVSTPYVEIEPEPHTVWPMSSCVYEENGRCGALLGYAVHGSDPVELRRHHSNNRVTPSYVENGWHLPESFVGLQAPATADPAMHVGWSCEDVDVHWHLNGTVLRLNQQTRRCPSSPFRSGDPTRDDTNFGVSADWVLAVGKPQARARLKSVTAQDAAAAWVAAGVEYPVVAERVAAEAAAAQQQTK